jgi:hypothetical protein
VFTGTDSAKVLNGKGTASYLPGFEEAKSKIDPGDMANIFVRQLTKDRSSLYPERSPCLYDEEYGELTHYC